MRIEQHYDEEVLASFLSEPVDATARDKHLHACPMCRQTLESIRGTAALLKSRTVWDRQRLSSYPRPDTLAFLRKVQTTMAEEDAAASINAASLLAGPRESWAARLDEHPEWRTAGLVRRLIAATDRAIDLMPPDALEITRLACDVAGHLPASDVATRLQGNAWYERGYALFYTGAFHEALEALDRAESHFSVLAIAAHEMGRLNLVRAMVYRALDRVEVGLPFVMTAATIFREYGDTERCFAAKVVVGNNLYSSRRFREALIVHLEIANSRNVSPRWQASALHSAAMCHRELGEMDSAIDCFVKAIAAFEGAGMMSFRAKARWTLACIFAAQQQFDAALAMFVQLREEFEELGMPRDVALVSLDIAELLLATEKNEGVVNACRRAIEYFEKSHLTDSQAALTAVTYLCEAALAGTATRKLVSDIRVSFFPSANSVTQRTERYEFLPPPSDHG
ncbi:MAG: hypothetical protein QOK37_4162 [Thermoanaerobaculia bacterium]|jgi:tetratricopeptide (TPR) repeat protein|nr:hypothetical protein [Thermoanaerobaculia bacterium]